MKKRGNKNNKKRTKQETIKIIQSVLVRYIILLLFGIFLFVFYKIFLPLTIWPSYLLLNIFYDASVSGDLIFVSGSIIKIIGACVAGSAYFLLLILNLTTPMDLKKRVYSLIFSFSSLLILNILRIFILSVLFIEDSAFFDLTHKFFWYVFSIVFVIGVWFLTAKLFKIKEIPIYSDFKRLR